MRISDSIPWATITGTLRTAVAPTRSNLPVPTDLLQISDAAQQKIDRLQQGNQALEQALAQSRQAARNAAIERVGHIKAYLLLLARMLPAGDRGAASEAARMAREIKSAAAGFKGGVAGEDGASVRADIEGFAGAAGDALKIAQAMVESYLRKRKMQQMGDAGLEQGIAGAVSQVSTMVHDTLNANDSAVAGRPRAPSPAPAL